ncbi:hydantoinase/oxoprolinase family protein [Conexibacter woesei]|uniref:Hydantoinase/oxoprolinase n=1 Tax=Conexibacter woesei (strain DSM 14684 / CCUG 47730 / CIP 108061 / JCM 11494 / NBRC 100937 / ID131577) TaxID=469383 RepID=D3F7B7_CONWI|nr:hydantoinase/oxoprolinase family protein [Conexibacter woesei]ADB48888.1 Hydantoinase/oxoprolinase [Conexibacter woesei DSM 14684]
MRFAIDCGGTFTDLVVGAADETRAYKALTVHADPVAGVLDAFDLAASDLGRTRGQLLADGELLLHATTRALNAVTEGRTAKTALLVTAGHPDVLSLREGGRHSLFDFATATPPPLVPRAWTYEIPERLDRRGRVVRPLDLDHVGRIAAELAEREVEAVAVSFLWSIVAPEHELAVEALLARALPGVPVSCGHRVNPVLREYRRTVATALDASLKPLMSDYLDDFERRLRAEGFGGRLLMTTSSGGAVPLGEVAARPVLSIGSGPAMAPIAARALPQVGAAGTAIVADTGGTTFDASVVRRGRVALTADVWLQRPFLGDVTGVPGIAVRSIGAGGGSIAWLDDGGLLRLGPQSAGSRPGPAAFGRGGEEPTLTDAAVVCGLLDPADFLGGRLRLDAVAARAAIERRVGAPLGLDAVAAAEAVLELATEQMAAALDELVAHEGIDPAEAVYVAGGGAAGLNACAIGRRLGCRRLIVPGAGPALSATGALVAPIGTVMTRALATSSADFDHAAAVAALVALDDDATGFARRAGAAAADRLEFEALCRYVDQAWELGIPIERDASDAIDVTALVAAFHAEHERLLGSAQPGAVVEVLGLQLRIEIGELRTPPGFAHGSGAVPPTRRARMGGADLDVQVLDVADVPRDGILGPAIVRSSLTTVVIPAGAAVRSDGVGGLEVDLAAGAGRRTQTTEVAA